MSDDFAQYLEPTYFLNYDHPEVAAFAATVCTEKQNAKEKAIALYYAVRDQIRYDPYNLRYARETIRASAVLANKAGYCVAKAVLLTALGRHQGIPSRLGFADVTNHLSTEKLRRLMGTDLFIYHGYTEFYLDEKWVKATPAFNLSLCEKFGVVPLEFDGMADSIFHPFDAAGRKHMQYIRDHGSFADLPFDRIYAAYDKTYPNFFKHFSDTDTTDFAADGASERAAKVFSAANER
jgi:transglutaminase-like putative cysteine protease